MSVQSAWLTDAQEWRAYTAGSVPNLLPLSPVRLLALLLPALLLGCGPEALPSTGDAGLGGVLVQGEGLPVRAGSTVQLYRPGAHDTPLARTQTGADGTFRFTGLPAGRYDLAFSAPGAAASELDGATAGAGATPTYTVQQRPARDAGAVLGVPQLLVTRPGTAGTLSPDSPNVFGDTVNVQAQTTAASPHQRPLVSFEFTLLAPDDAGTFTRLHPAGGRVTPAPSPDVAGSGAVTLNAGPMAGDAVLEVAATDFNNNRVAALYPLTLTRTAASAAVTPQDVRAVAYTWAGTPGGTEGTSTVQPQALGGTAIPLNLRVQLSWSVPSLDGLRGFEVWRAGAAAGPWARVALAGPDACTGNVCQVPDTTPGLRPGADYFYRVTAVGAGTASSTVGSTPDTHVLPLFGAVLAPVTTPAPLAPAYTLQVPLKAAGANGALLTLTVNDELSGQTLWRAPALLRQVPVGGGTDTQVLLNHAGRYDPAYSRLSPANNVPGVGVDAAGETLTLTHDLDGTGRPLQTVRGYRVALPRAAAFRLHDPAAPVSALNPVVAYSIASDSTGPDPQDCPAAPLLPGGPCVDAAGVQLFRTGAGP